MKNVLIETYLCRPINGKRALENMLFENSQCQIIENPSKSIKLPKRKINKTLKSIWTTKAQVQRKVADVKPLKCGDEFINFVNNQLIAGELLHFSCEL